MHTDAYTLTHTHITNTHTNTLRVLFLRLPIQKALWQWLRDSMCLTRSTSLSSARFNTGTWLIWDTSCVLCTHTHTHHTYEYIYRTWTQRERHTCYYIHAHIHAFTQLWLCAYVQTQTEPHSTQRHTLSSVFPIQNTGMLMVWILPMLPVFILFWR